MAMQSRYRWEAAFHRLRLLFLVELDATDILDQSRERIWHARNALARTAPRSRRPPFVYCAPPPASVPDGDGPNYFALILDSHGVVSTHKLLARDDDQAVDQAWVQADTCGFDVWDGWRFIERFESADP